MRKTFSIFFLWSFVFSLLSIVPAFANNLQIANFYDYSTDTSANTMTFTFNVTQDNSWRNATNYDAVWMFMKYSTDGGASWNHGSMSASGTNPTGFNAPTGFEIKVPADEKGFFLQRTDLAAGSISASGVRVVWDYGQDGLSDATAQAGNTTLKIFGLEMVYIPEGSFYAGDASGGNLTAVLKQGSADEDSWYIASENAINATNASADGYYYFSAGQNDEDVDGATFLIPAQFPKGYQAFYLMKYELTEGQWVSFFNTLTTDQKTIRDITSSTAGGKNSDAVILRNTISWDSASPLKNAKTTRPDRAVSYIGWPDICAYADWAALRPYTELEFEKAARGAGITAVSGEYAWGNTTITAAATFSGTPENGTETIATASANANYNNTAFSLGDDYLGVQYTRGPVRVGIFATSVSTRTTAGTGYYGNMELSGNLWEPTVTVGNSWGRVFLGTHGDGTLTTLASYEGNATNLDWPGFNSANPTRGVNGTKGSGYKGGGFETDSFERLGTSSRRKVAANAESDASTSYRSHGGQFFAGRLARTAD
ncbi:MAG: SUMF1/EgtB/PvdO family nonheme iron enzyme [Candidatus Omnitrophota bacterium]